MILEQLKEFIELCQHPAIKEKFDGWRIGDEWVDKIGGRNYTHYENDVFGLPPIPKDVIWLPPVFSYTDSSRSLWAWVDWELFGLATHEDGLTTVYSPKSNFQYTGPFFIALAKAVIWKYEQENK